MKSAVTSLIVATVAALALAGCESAEDKAKAAAERPNADGPTAEEVAARVTTPSVSMTPAEREESRLKTVSLLDDVGADRAEGHTRTPGVQDQVVAMQPLQSHNFTVPMTQGPLPDLRGLRRRLHGRGPVAAGQHRQGDQVRHRQRRLPGAGLHAVRRRDLLRSR